jgi:outer membrane protein insertion porin family
MGWAGVLAILAVLAFTLPSHAQSGPSGTKILVLPFSVNTAADQKGVAASLPGILSESLRREGIAVVTEKPSGTIDDQTARRLAAAAKATHALYGSVSQVGESLSIDGRLVPVAEGAPLSVFAQAKELMQLEGAGKELAGKVRGLLVTGDAIVDVAVEGNQILDKDVIILKAKTQVGQPYDPKSVNDDLKRLFETGYFEDVQIRLENAPGGKKLVFVVKEKPRIQAVGVIGSGEVDQDKILETMSTKAGSILNLKVLAEDLEKIRELYRKEGFYKTEVNYELEQTDPRIARLNIIVKEPKKLYIREVKIEGVSQVDADDLRDELSTSERRFWSWATGSGVLKEEMLERDVAAIENFYANRGYVDVKVGQPDVEYGDNGIAVIFRVSEGDRYKVGKVGFTGDLFMDNDTLMQIVKLDQLAEEGSYFDRSVVRDDLNLLTEMYGDFGYAFAQADVDLMKNEADKTIDVNYSVNKGRRVYIRRVLIEGNEKTRDNVIRREMRLGDGSLFNGTLVRRSNERLDRLDYFEKVDIETVPTENPTEVDLKVKVKDKNTGAFSLGAGYSTYDSVFFGGSVEERNVFGKGYHAKFQGMISGSSSRFILTLMNPRFNDSNLTTGISLYDLYKKYDDYSKETIGAKLTFGYPLGEYTMLTWSYRLDRYRIYDTNWYPSSVIASSEGTHWSSSVMVEADRDTTDSATRPTKGTKNTVSIEYAGGVLQGDDDFIRPIVTSNYFHPLPWDLVFHWRGSAGALFENGGDIPVFERFYLGGIENVRGYEQNKISPKDSRTGERIGGKLMFFTNFETVYPISKSNGVWGLVFFDAGNTWAANTEMDWSLYKSVGAGLRWYSPMGLIRVEYGYGLDAEANNLWPHQIGFSMGQSF